LIAVNIAPIKIVTTLLERLEEGPPLRPIFANLASSSISFTMTSMSLEPKQRLKLARREDPWVFQSRF
jgi:hypothetical protein